MVRGVAVVVAELRAGVARHPHPRRPRSRSGSPATTTARRTTARSRARRRAARSSGATRRRAQVPRRDRRSCSFQNLHRYALYFALVVHPDPRLRRGRRVLRATASFGVGVGSIVLLVNVVLIASYTFGCHSFRHLIGGAHRLHVVRPADGSRSALGSARRGSTSATCIFAWTSLFWVGFTDVYVRLVVDGRHPRLQHLETESRGRQRRSRRSSTTCS